MPYVRVEINPTVQAEIDKIRALSGDPDVLAFIQSAMGTYSTIVQHVAAGGRVLLASDKGHQDPDAIRELEVLVRR